MSLHPGWPRHWAASSSGSPPAALYLLQGRIAGISGIARAALTRRPAAWRWTFLGALIASGLAALLAGATTSAALTQTSLPLLIIAGLLTGLGAGIGSGCTSGHGVCGIARGRRRSLAATALFVATASITVFVFRQGVAG